jgi:hypothetical protein
MSIHVVVQALEWLPVLWLVTVHLLIERGRLPCGGWAFRIAAGSAAASLLVASLATGTWQMAALGLLWLRTEVFAHSHPTEQGAADRHPAHRARAELADTGPAGTERTGTGPARPGQVKDRPDRPHEIRIQQDWAPRPNRPNRPHPDSAATPTSGPAQRRQRSAFTNGLFRFGPPAMAWLFKIEIVVVIIVALVLFAGWSAEQRSSFNHRANTTLCGLMGGC